MAVSVRQLCEGLADGDLPAGVLARDVTCHSKQVKRGDLFIAVQGTARDGHAFIAEAAQRGACAVVVERRPSASVSCPVVVVPSTKRALPVIASRFFGHPSDRLRTIGVTGTNGKTTTTYLLKCILEAAGERAGLLGTVAYEIGARHLPSVNTTPGVIELQRYLAQMADAGMAWCAMEVSSHALDQGRVDGLRFDAAVWTNLGSDHLDYHKTRAQYAQTKERLFTYLRPGGKAVLNLDDEHARGLIPQLSHLPVVTYGLEHTAMVRVRILQCGWEGTQLVLDSPWGMFAVQSPMMGRHNVLNLAAACAASLSLGVPPGAIQQALSEFRNVPGRLEHVPNDAGIHVIVDFAHTPDALRQVLLSLRELVSGRIITVFGCGGDRDRTKRPVMGQIASLLADAIVLTCDNPRHEDPKDILRQIRAGFVPTYTQFQVIEDREQAIAGALAMARPGDAVLIAGKGHEMYQIFDQVTVPFSDRDVVERYFTRTKPVSIS